MVKHKNTRNEKGIIMRTSVFFLLRTGVDPRELDIFYSTNYEDSIAFIYIKQLYS